MGCYPINQPFLGFVPTGRSQQCACLIGHLPGIIAEKEAVPRFPLLLTIMAPRSDDLCRFVLFCWVYGLSCVCQQSSVYQVSDCHGYGQSLPLIPRTAKPEPQRRLKLNKMQIRKA
jgi:hypothetical protein